MNEFVTKTATERTTARLFSRFYGSAREGMADVLRAVRISSDETVLLPAFIGFSSTEGSGVYDPVRESGAQTRFYPLDQNLSPDIDAVASLVALPGVRVLVVIHYYGRTAEHLNALRRLADAHGVLLVEDLAHGFFTASRNGLAGALGDVQLLSLHKMLPTPDGGMLRIRDRDLADACLSTRPEFSQFVLDFDWQMIAEVRRQRFNQLSELLRRSSEFNHKFTLPWERLSAHDVPQTLPVRVLNGARDAIYFAMNSAGFGAVSLYHTLIQEVRGSHPDMERLSRQIINLPVHQDVREESLAPLVESFLEALCVEERSPQ